MSKRSASEEEINSLVLQPDTNNNNNYALKKSKLKEEEDEIKRTSQLSAPTILLEGRLFLLKFHPLFHYNSLKYILNTIYVLNRAHWSYLFHCFPLFRPISRICLSR